MTETESDTGRVRVASTAAFDVGVTKIVDVRGREVAVVRTENGYFGLLNKCPHQGGPVGEGRVTCSFKMGPGGTGVTDLEVDCERLVVSCPWHGWPFDLETGVHVTDPEYVVPTYDIVVEDGDVFVEV